MRKQITKLSAVYINTVLILYYYIRGRKMQNKSIPSIFTKYSVGCIK